MGGGGRGGRCQEGGWAEVGNGGGGGGGRQVRGGGEGLGGAVGLVHHPGHAGHLCPHATIVSKGRLWGRCEMSTGGASAAAGGRPASSSNAAAGEERKERRKDEGGKDGERRE